MCLNTFPIWVIARVKDRLGGKLSMARVSLTLLLTMWICWWLEMVEAEYVKYKDPKQPVAVRVRDLLGRMTLEEKIGQMVQIDRSVATFDTLRTYSIGSVLSGGGSTPLPQATAQDWVNMINGFQNGSLSSRLGIPMIYGIDAVHGHNNVYNATIFPHNIGLGATRNKVAACAKHFVGDGGTTKGINENNTVIDRHGLLSIHMPAYSDSIIKGVSTVMVSYSSWNGEKMHANPELITGFLKGTLKFKGFVISDWEGIDRITTTPHSNYSYSVQAAIQAGIDMVMVPFNYSEFINDLTDHVKSRIIPMDRIDDAVSRILLVKFTVGLFENPLADFSLVNELGSQPHRDLAREAVRKSLVLLKNGKNKTNPVLPLPKKVPKILVAGTHADDLGYQCGGWTISWQGFSGNNYTRGATIRDAVKAAVDPSTEIIYNENPNTDFVKKNDFAYAIVAIGEHPYAETSGDSMALTMADPGPTIISNVCQTVKCVVVIISGRPIVLEPYVSQIDALVAAWLPGTEGQGITDVLYGDFGFSGKLSRTWFKSVDQLPMNVGDSHYDPLFAFEFGLETRPVKDLVSRPTSAAVGKRPYVLAIIITMILLKRLLNF